MSQTAQMTQLQEPSAPTIATLPKILESLPHCPPAPGGRLGFQDGDLTRMTIKLSRF